jgi:hypothetical protein
MQDVMQQANSPACHQVQPQPTAPRRLPKGRAASAAVLCINQLQPTMLKLANTRASPADRTLVSWAKAPLTLVLTTLEIGCAWAYSTLLNAEYAPNIVNGVSVLHYRFNGNLIHEAHAEYDAAT